MLDGNSLKMMRETVGMTQKSLASDTHISVETVKRIEKGVCDTPCYLLLLELFLKDKLKKMYGY